jgi:cystathionine beta-lyase/cystathionine gamma-synthase
MEEEKWVIDIKNGNKYSRGYHSELHKLNLDLQQCYSQTNGDVPIELDSVVATSGMHAITITLDAVAESLDTCNMIFGSELYCDTSHVLSSRTDCNLFPIDVLDTPAVMELFAQLAGQNNVLFVESCSNPSGHIFDFRLLPELRQLSKTLLVIVDNTWLTHVVFNPFDFDVDIVVSSLTKYYSGGTIIAGTSLFRKQHHALHQNICSKMRWIHISGYDCVTIRTHMTTMNSRLQSSSALCTQLLHQVQTHADCSWMQSPVHPSLPGHPSHSLAQLWFRRDERGELLFPSCFTFQVAGVSSSRLRKVFQSNAVLDYITSFGCPKSRIDPYPQKCKSSNTIRVRFAVGFDDDCDRVMGGLRLISAQFCQV